MYRSLCDAVIPYTYFTHAYSGKPSQTNEESSNYYVKETDEYTKYLVNGACKYTLFSGCSISLDLYFTSVSIAVWTIEKGSTLVGTMQLKIPKEIKTGNIGRTNQRCMHMLKNKISCLFLTLTKKKSDKKNVVVLTTMHDNVGVTKDGRRKPDVHVTYNHAKGGVDIVDLISTHNSTRMK